MLRGSRRLGGANIFPPATLSSSHEGERHLELMQVQGTGGRPPDDQGVVRDGYPLTAPYKGLLSAALALALGECQSSRRPDSGRSHILPEV
jgi:hypothetical protein